MVDVLPGLKAGASTPPDGSAVAPQGPPPFLPALKDGVSRRISMNMARQYRSQGVMPGCEQHTGVDCGARPPGKSASNDWQQNGTKGVKAEWCDEPWVVQYRPWVRVRIIHAVR